MIKPILNVVDSSVRLRSSTKGALASAAMLALIQAPVYAQSETSRPMLEEIVVTSQKRAENLQDIPIAVSAHSGPVLMDVGIDGPAALPRLTPGLNFNLGAGFSSPYLRGIGTVFATLGLEPSVATYLDDQYQSRPVSGFFSFQDIERIEVLKGPQGSLYGRNAAAGAIRVITRDPTQELELRTEVALGNLGRQGVNALVNLPLTDKLSSRFAVSYESRDSYIKSADPAHGPGDKRDVTVRGKFLYEPTDTTTIKLSLDYADTSNPEAVAFVLIDKSAPEAVGLVRGGTPTSGFYRSGAQFDQSNSEKIINETKGYGMQLRADFDLPAAVVSSITTYRRSDESQACDHDLTEVPYNHCAFEEITDAYSQEIQAVSTEGDLRWVGGLFYYYEKGDNEYLTFGQTINDLFALPYGPTIGRIDDNPVYAMIGEAKTESFAPYVQVTYPLSDRFEVTLGARYTWETKTLLENTNVLWNVGPADILMLSELDTEYKFRQFTPKATLSYLADNALLYLTYSRGFKSGGVNLPSNALSTKIDPEILDSLEFGWKAEFDRVRFNGAIFYYDYQDLQVQTPGGLTGARLENAADAELYGIEMDITVAVSDRLTLAVGANYLHSEYEDYLGTSSVPASSTAACAAAGGPVAPYAPECIGYTAQSADFSGRTMINAPKYSGYLRGRYEIPLSGNFGSLALSSLLSFSDRSYYNPEHSLVEPSKSLLSASATWTSVDGNYWISLFGDNLLDEEYDTYKVIITDPAAYRTPGAPRTWGARFGVNW